MDRESKDYKPAGWLLYDEIRKTRKGTDLVHRGESDMEKQNLTVEQAYVKSKRYLSLVTVETMEACSKMRDLAQNGLVAGLVIGAVMMLLTRNPASFIAPLAIILGRVLPTYVRANRILQDGLQRMKREKEKLEKGEIDPRVFYENTRKKLAGRGKENILDAIKVYTAGLSAKEREMLLKFSDEDSIETDETKNSRLIGIHA